MPNETTVCAICQKVKLKNELVAAGLIRENVVELIRRDHSDWSERSFICSDDLNHYRGLYVKEILLSDKGELDALESEVVESIKAQELLANNLNNSFTEKFTTGQRVADSVAKIGGSWRFIIGFGVFLALWILMNSLVLLYKPFDPYPFILLNLMLSCLAAMQAPIIMMSQKRQEDKDRLRSESDYRTNLKAELEVRLLHEKLDHLLTHQWQRLLEIQELQLELMEELSKQNSAAKNNKESP
jgi:uncharacterized membrane protein